MSEKMELAEAGKRHADGLTAQLERLDWRPSRAHIEQARNSIEKLSAALRASPAEGEADPEALALANDYQRGLDRMETAGYEEFAEVIPKHKLIIKALRALALYPAGDGREADSLSGDEGKPE